MTGTEFGSGYAERGLINFGLSNGLNVINLTGRQWRNIQNLQLGSFPPPGQGSNGNFQLGYGGRELFMILGLYRLVYLRTLRLILYLTSITSRAN